MDLLFCPVLQCKRSYGLCHPRGEEGERYSGFGCVCVCCVCEGAGLREKEREMGRPNVVAMTRGLSPYSSRSLANYDVSVSDVPQ